MSALPDRRPSEQFRLDLMAGARLFELYATLGYHPVTAQPLEIFLRHRGPEGSDIALLLDDVGELFSHALQAGIQPSVLATKFGRLGQSGGLGGELDGGATAPRASVIGALADWLAEQAAEPLTRPLTGPLTNSQVQP